MNVAHLVFSFENGGIENLLVDMLNNWPDSERVILCIVNDVKSDKLLEKINNKKNLVIYKLDRKPNSSFKTYIKTLKSIYKIIKTNNIDIIHFHSQSVLKFASPLKIVRPKIKYFLTIHATNIYYNISNFELLFEKIMLKKIFAISVPVKNEIINRGFPKKRVRLIYNATDPKKFIINQGKNNIRKKIICIARLVPNVKGQDILINAISYLKKTRKDFECSIVGAEPKEHPEYKEEILDMIKKNELEDFVKLLGNRDDVPNLLSQSDIFVLPSRREGFGISVIEAMFSKVLVIVSDVEALKKLVGNNEYGYVFENENYVELAKIIDKALNENNTEKINNAYNYVMNNYNIVNMVKLLNEEYKNN